jgi:hypothetical protein
LLLKKGLTSDGAFFTSHGKKGFQKSYLILMDTAQPYTTHPDQTRSH